MTTATTPGKADVLTPQLANTTEHAQYAQQSQWLTSREAGEYLKIPSRTLLAWARDGKVKGYTLCGIKRHVWRFLREDLNAILTLPVVLSQKERVN